jgi:transcriptional regulator with XRE-family HTH domain
MSVLVELQKNMTMVTMTLKTQLRAYLERMDMTAAQLSRKSGVSQQVLSTWLRGGEPKKLSQIKSVASVLSTTVDQLCFGSGVNKESNKIKNIDSILGDEWIGGVFEVRFRRLNK